jgi:hypothetical protein
MKCPLLLVIAAVLVASDAAAAVKHKSKRKEKSFEPVAAADVGGYAGRYVGIESSHWVDVDIGPEDRLEVTVFENGVRVPLRNIKLTGTRLVATKLLPGDTEASLEATFGERRVNDDRAFGLLVEGDVHLDGSTVLNRLFYRRVRTTPAP